MSIPISTLLVLNEIASKISIRILKITFAMHINIFLVYKNVIKLKKINLNLTKLAKGKQFKQSVLAFRMTLPTF